MGVEGGGCKCSGVINVAMFGVTVREVFSRGRG